MKTRFVMLSVAVFAFASCTQLDMQHSENEIRLDAGEGRVSRATGSELEYLSELGERIGIYGVVTEKTDVGALLEGDWTETPLMSNVKTTGVDQATGAMSWTDTYNYPQEGGRQVKFCAYHPYAPVGTQGDNYVSVAAGRAPQLRFTLTGGEDVMFADPVSGSRVQPASALNFNHVLTQFNFQLVNADGFFSKSLTGIRFKGVNTRSAMDMETGALGAWDAPSDAVAVASFDAPQPITGTKDVPQKVGREVMLQPGLPSYTVVIEFDNGDESEIAIKPQGEATFEAGKSYLITLKFSGKVVFLASASVTPWGAGATGGGTLD